MPRTSPRPATIALAALAALGTPSGCDEEDPYASYRQACVDRINAYRAGIGVTSGGSVRAVQDFR